MILQKKFFVDIMNRHFDSQLKITGSPSSASGTAIPSTLLQIASKKNGNSIDFIS